MSDRQPPSYGPASYDEWDLEALLSGELAYVPDALRPVAETMAELRAAPAPGELAGEAAARAEFHASLAVQDAPAPPAGVTGLAGVPGGAHTLILPSRSADDLPLPSAARHRHRRRHAMVRRRPWQAMAVLATTAAAAVVVGVAALAGTFSGSAGPQGPSAGRESGASPTTSASGGIRPGSQAVDGGADKEQPARPAPEASAASQQAAGSGAQPGSGMVATPAGLCQQYFAFLAQPESASNWQEENGDIQELTKLAGGLWHIPGYCYQLGHPSSAAPPASPSYPGWRGYPGSGDPQGKGGPGGYGAPGGYGGGTGAGQHWGGGHGHGSGTHGSSFGTRR